MMKIEIKKIQIEDNPSNEVTSSKVFASRKIMDKHGNLIFHKDGIFSDRIFGRVGKCKCGNKKTPGICPDCGCRVLERNKVPNYYIKLPCRVPNPLLNDIPDEHKKVIPLLLNYEGYLVNKKFYELDALKFPEDIKEEDVKSGKEAILELGLTEEWYLSNTTDKLYIPHPSQRKIIRNDNGRKYLGKMNLALVSILKQKEKLAGYIDFPGKYTELIINKKITEQVNQYYSYIFESLSNGKNSIVSKEIRGQALTGAIRAVLTNNFELNEDYVILGKYFIQTLYPYLYNLYTKNGITDIAEINQELKLGGYKVLINRPPTLSEKSFMAFKPIFSELDSEQYVIQMNPASFDGFAGDTDGDCLLVISLYTQEANSQAELLLPSQNYIGNANGEIRNGIFEDFLHVMQRLYDMGEYKEIRKYIDN